MAGDLFAVFAVLVAAAAVVVVVPVVVAVGKNVAESSELFSILVTLP